MTNDPDLIVYSGSFDPPHAGHAGCVDACLERFSLADVMIVPSPSPAGVGNQHKTPVVPFRDRMKLCVLQFHSRIQSGEAKVSNVEEDLPSPNYTIQTLRKVREQNGDRNLGFLIGLDQLKQFDLWKEPVEILKSAHLIVVKRKEESESELKSEIHKMLKKLNLAFNDQKDFVEIPSLESKIFAIEKNLSPAASSKIRAMIASKEEIPKGWMNPAVENYIRKNGFFASKETDDEDD